MLAFGEIRCHEILRGLGKKISPEFREAVMGSDALKRQIHLSLDAENEIRSKIVLVHAAMKMNGWSMEKGLSRLEKELD